MSQQIQTDNSFLEEKVFLRLNSIEQIEKEEINVLECFGGDGIIWNQVQKKTKKKINTLRIDVKTDKRGIYLQGNNLKYLRSFPLFGFDIIDLDAYGSPFQQLQMVLNRHYKGIVHCTFIQSGMVMLNHDLLEAVGYTRAMVKKCPTLFTKVGFEKICQYLAQNGVQRIQTISIDRKHYFWFNTSIKPKKPPETALKSAADAPEKV